MAEASHTSELNKKTYQDPVITKDGDIVISRDISTNLFTVILSFEIFYKISNSPSNKIFKLFLPSSTILPKKICLDGHLDIVNDITYLLFPDSENCVSYNHYNAKNSYKIILSENSEKALDLVTCNEKPIGKLHMTRNIHIYQNKDYKSDAHLNRDYHLPSIGTSLTAAYNTHIINDNFLLIYKHDLDKNLSTNITPATPFSKSAIETETHYYFTNIMIDYRNFKENENKPLYTIEGGPSYIKGKNILNVLSLGSNHYISSAYVPHNYESIISSTRSGIHANSSFLEYIKQKTHNINSSMKITNDLYILNLDINFQDKFIRVMLGEVNMDNSLPENQIIIGADCFNKGLAYHFIHIDNDTYRRRAFISISKEDVIPCNINLETTGIIGRSNINNEKITITHVPKAFMGTTKYGITFLGDKIPEATKTPEERIKEAKYITSDILSVVNPEYLENEGLEDMSSPSDIDMFKISNSASNTTLPQPLNKMAETSL